MSAKGVKPIKCDSCGGHAVLLIVGLQLGERAYLCLDCAIRLLTAVKAAGTFLVLATGGRK